MGCEEETHMVFDCIVKLSVLARGSASAAYCLHHMT